MHAAIADFQHGQVGRYAPEAVVYHDVEPAPSIAGVPRHLVRTFVASRVRRSFSVDSVRRYCHKLQTCRTAGEIAEARSVTPPADTLPTSGETHPQSPRSSPAP